MDKIILYAMLNVTTDTINNRYTGGDNYRPTTIIYVASKILQLVMLNEFLHTQETTCIQFGFKGIARL